MSAGEMVGWIVFWIALLLIGLIFSARAVGLLRHISSPSHRLDAECGRTSAHRLDPPQTRR